MAVSTEALSKALNVAKHESTLVAWRGVMSNIYTYAGVLGIAFLAVGLFFYAWFLYRAYWEKDEMALKTLNENLAANLGIPCSALAAFGLVSILNIANLPTDDKGVWVIEAFSLNFSGPAGPLMLWVVCFLALIAALKTLRAP